MEEFGIYRGFKLQGDLGQQPGFDGVSFWVACLIQNRQGEERLFTEVASISRTAIAIFSIQKPGVDVENYIKSLAYNRAIARIDMGMYENGKDYIYTIYSKDLEQPQENQEITDDDIVLQYLRTLKNIRKSNPTRYVLDGTNLDGFCSLLGISKQRFLYIATALKEDGIVESGKVREATVQIGGGHITSYGLRYLNNIESEIRKENVETSSEGGVEQMIDKKVFIIHGHDNELKTQVQLLIERAGLNEVVLHECADKGRTIIDKLEQESQGACYVIALLSPDDELADGEHRARQNVILEIGYFLGKLGKERVRLLIRGDVKIPSDLQGILYETYDAAGAWRIGLVKEMQAVGIDVQMDRIVGKF